MNQEREDETREASPSCKCYVQARDIPCPVHGHDRSSTLDRDRKPERVINTTASLRKPS